MAPRPKKNSAAKSSAPKDHSSKTHEPDDLWEVGVTYALQYSKKALRYAHNELLNNKQREIVKDKVVERLPEPAQKILSTILYPSHCSTSSTSTASADSKTTTAQSKASAESPTTQKTSAKKHSPPVKTRKRP